MRREIGQLASGQVVADRPNSHIHSNVSEELLLEAFDRVHIYDSDSETSKTTHVIEVEFGRIIGKSNKVPVRQGDETYYARRRGRGKWYVCVDRPPEDCSSLVLVLKQIGKDIYLLLTAYVGKDRGSVRSRDDASESVPTLVGYALTLSDESIIPSSITSRAPESLRAVAD